MKIRRIDEYKISKENSSIFNISIIAIDKRKEFFNLSCRFFPKYLNTYNKNTRREIDGNKICGKVRLGHSEHL